MNASDDSSMKDISFLQSGDPLILENFFVKNSILPIGTIFLYLLTIYVLGPWLMKDRQPIRLKKTILAYNALTVLANGYCCYKVIEVIVTHGVRVLCIDPENCALHQLVRRNAIGLVMQIYGLKFLEMLDTIFFVMAKKYDHISNLHSFHHSSVPFLVWFSLRTQTRMHLIMYGLVNSFIHVIMYSYYGLSLLGPRFQFIRRFKRYITLIQIVQFFVMLPYFLYIIGIGCANSKAAVVVFSLHTLLLIFLFGDYYIKSYSSSPKRRKLAFKKPIEDIQANGAEKKIS